MFPDRGLQLKILEELKAIYPESVNPKKLSCYPSDSSFTMDADLTANLFYLHEHEVIYAEKFHGLDMPRDLNSIRITRKGIDLLAKDGGLSAVFNKVHIKFDENDLRALIAAQIDKSNLSETKKLEAKGMLATIKAEGVKTLCSELFKLSIAKAPDVLQSIQTALQS